MLEQQIIKYTQKEPKHEQLYNKSETESLQQQQGVFGKQPLVSC
jgi:hypothetical protein